MENLPVKKSKTPKLNRWIIETPRNRENLPSPIGYTNQRADIVSQGDKRVCTLLNTSRKTQTLFSKARIKVYWTNEIGTLHSKISNRYQ